MPGELERLIIALMQPKPGTVATALATVQLQYDTLALTASESVTSTFTPNNTWDTGRWGEALWG